MLDLALDVGNGLAGIALVPRAVELFGGNPELDNEVAGQVLRLGSPPFLPPELDQGGFIAAYDDPGVGAADECSTVCSHLRFHASTSIQNGLCLSQAKGCRMALYGSRRKKL